MSWNGVRALVTGGAGAIGCNLTRALLEAGAQVVVLDDLSSGSPTNVPDAAHFVRGSIVDDGVLRQCFDRSIDLVFHLAALFANQNSVEHPEEDLLVNGLGTLKVLQWSLRRQVSRVVFASSSCVYGAAGDFAESARKGLHRTPYAITKSLGEDYAALFRSLHGLPVVTLRYFNSYGPGEYPGRYRNVIPNFLSNSITSQPIVITGDGQETRDFTYVADTVAATLSAATKPAAVGEVINVGTGREVSINELVRTIADVTGRKLEITYAPRRAWDDVSRRCASIEKARSLLDFAPRVGLAEGLERTYRWLAENLPRSAVVQ